MALAQSFTGEIIKDRKQMQETGTGTNRANEETADAAEHTWR